MDTDTTNTGNSSPTDKTNNSGNEDTPPLCQPETPNLVPVQMARIENTLPLSTVDPNN